MAAQSKRHLKEGTLVIINDGSFAGQTGTVAEDWSSGPVLVELSGNTGDTRGTRPPFGVAWLKVTSSGGSSIRTRGWKT